MKKKILIIEIYTDRGINLDMEVRETSFEELLKEYNILKEDLSFVDEEQEIISFEDIDTLEVFYPEKYNNIQKKSFTKTIFVNIDKLDIDFSTHIDVLFTTNKHGFLDLENYETV